MEQIYFATNRNLEGTKAKPRFGRRMAVQGPAYLRFGVAKVAAKGSFKISVEAESLKPDSTGTGTDLGQSTLGSSKTFEEVRNQMSVAGSDTIIFIHGYNVSFRDALDSALRMKRNLSKLGDTNVNVALFSWPSDGTLFPWLAYASDRRDAAASGPAFARGLLKAGDFLRSLSGDEACDRAVHLVAHSMGNYVLRHALQHMVKETSSRLLRLFDHIFLLAADEDDDAFEHDHKLRLLPNLCKQAHVYFNRGDMAMAVSDATKGNPARLGADGARVPFQLPARVHQIDCSTVVQGFKEHSYYINEPRVVADMSHVLRGTDPDESPTRRFRARDNTYVLR